LGARNDAPQSQRRPRNGLHGYRASKVEIFRDGTDMIDEDKLWDILGRAANNWLDREIAEGFFAEVRERMAKAEREDDTEGSTILKGEH